MPLQGPTGMTLLFEGDMDDDFIQLPDIGFPFPFYSGTYQTDIYLGSNSYLTFGSGTGSRFISFIDEIALMVSAGDRSMQRAYGQAVNSSEYRIRYEGHENYFGGEIGSPTIVWEVQLFDDGSILLSTGIFEDPESMFTTDANETNQFTYLTEANRDDVLFTRLAPDKYAITNQPPPPKTFNPSPGDGQTDVDTYWYLDWFNVAPEYDIYFGTTNPPPFSTNTEDSFYDGQGIELEYETLYYWRIDTVNPGSTPSTTTGDTWSFTTEQTPPQEFDLSLTDQGEGTYLLEWTAQPPGIVLERYEVQRNSPDTSFQTIATLNPSIRSYLDTEPKERSTTYQYFVRAENDSGSANSDFISVTTAPTDKLNADQLTQIEFHLSLANIRMPEGITTTLYNQAESDRIDLVLTDTDTAFNSSKLGGGTLIPERGENISQGIIIERTDEFGTTTTTYGDRVESISRRPSWSERISAYYRQVEFLAKSLGIDPYAPLSRRRY